MRRDYRELAPDRERFSYFAACDPAAGGADNFTLGVGHRDGERIVVDLVRRWKASKPESVVDEIALVLGHYGIGSITGDRFTGSWVRDAFVRRGIEYRICQRTRSENYLEMQSSLLQGGVDLPQNEKLIRELRGLERRSLRSGREEVNHGPSQHDDYANSAAIVIVELAFPRPALVWEPYETEAEIKARELRRMERMLQQTRF